jgi:hypothetical protein
MKYDKIAEELLKQFETKRFEQCEKCFHQREDIIAFTDVALGIENKPSPLWHEELSDCVHEASELVGFDYGYRMVHDALQAVVDAGAEDSDSALEAMQDMESPCYTRDLLDFYSSALNHTWLTDAAKEENSDYLLNSGYDLAQQEVSELVRRMLEELCEDEE